ncbi:MAG: hypothetical protein SFV15_16825 [Polyangiaceae bacterium]|nr:hypothetical protein [Polyangiaceae bacterium]
MQTHTNINQDPKALEAFNAAIESEDWIEALRILTRGGFVCTPSQAPTLRAALLADPSLLKTSEFVSFRETGSKREIDGKCLAPELNASGDIIDSWTSLPSTLEDRFPHFSTAWRAKYQIHHHICFGQTALAGKVIRDHALSCRFDDYEGALANYLRNNFRSDFVQNRVSCAAPVHPSDQRNFV